ncbi:MAG: lytic transglycosylase domain-containing protein [Candidatus Bruticola sp.]
MDIIKGTAANLYLVNLSNAIKLNKAVLRHFSMVALGACLFWGATVDSVWADEIRAEVRMVNGHKEIVYTNEANDAYKRSVRSANGVTIISDYPTYKGKARSASAKQKNSEAPGKTVAVSPASSASANKKVAPKGKRRPDGTYEFAPPQYEVYEIQPNGYYRDDWSFATFDAAKRQPRLVSYYGWDPNDASQNQRTWVEVDINPIILKYAKIWGVDPLLVEIVICHESGFNPRAVSPAGAVGLMQLMPVTASGLGVYDVYDVEQNIAGGTRYIAAQLERFNSVPLALAAYNAGPGAVLQYGGVPPYSETQYYVDTIYGEYLAGKRAREGR